MALIAKNQPNPEPIERLSLLVADPDTALQDAFWTLFGASGNFLIAVGTSEQAMQVLATGAFDAVIIDHSVDGMLGLGLVVQVDRLRPRPWIVFTSSFTGLEKQARSLGANAFVRKPLTLENLRAALAHVQPGSNSESGVDQPRGALDRVDARGPEVEGHAGL